MCSVNFGSSGALRYGPPSVEYAPLAAALASSHTPLLLHSRSTRDPVSLGSEGTAANIHTGPHLRVASGFAVAQVTPSTDGIVVATYAQPADDVAVYMTPSPHKLTPVYMSLTPAMLLVLSVSHNSTVLHSAWSSVCCAVSVSSCLLPSPSLAVPRTCRRWWSMTRC